MTREQAEKEIRDNFTEVWADGIIKALEQEPRKGLDELETFSVKQGASLEKLDEDAKETISHLIECYEDGCFTKDERVTLAGIALNARIRFQLNKKYMEVEDCK